MKTALILGLTLIALGWLQATALLLITLGAELGMAQMINVLSGRGGILVALIAAAVLLTKKMRARSENYT